MNWHEYFTYDAGTGDLIWKERPMAHFRNEADFKRWNTRWAGKVSGNINAHGYRVCRVGGKNYRYARIIWEMHHGPIPDGMQIDHINGNRSDDRIVNHRCCTESQNYVNKLRHSRTSSGLKGVYANKGGWCSKIKAHGKMLHLGTYGTKAEAAVVFAKASLRYHGKFSVYCRSILVNA